MMKVGDVVLTWAPDPANDIVSVKLTITVNGTVQTTQMLAPNITSFTTTVKANSTVNAKFEVTDRDGLVATTEYNFPVNDLETPTGVSNVSHQIINIREVPDE